MPATRRNKRSASPVEASSPLAYLSYGPPGLQLNSHPLPPATPETDASPSPPAKKKRSHGKARPPGHIPRPPNAFIIFRTEYIKSMATQNSTPEVSKSLGERWRNMSPGEKRPWVEKAEDAKIKHQLENPDYKYKPVHPRDEFGNCIRKPRKPNRPRVKQTPRDGDVLDNLSASFQWLEGKRDAEFPNLALPSDASSASSPPPSPSPAPSLVTSPPSFYAAHRRSSSVPLAGPDDSFFFGAAPTGSAYPPSPMGLHISHVSRRLSKRPSTSMDFMCAGPSHAEAYSFNGTEPYLSPGDPQAFQWRPGHRRSISAPGIGEIPAAQFTHGPSHSFAQEANPLTPINPVFGNVFDRFTWNTAQAQMSSSNANSTSPYASADYTTTHAYATPNNPGQQYITVNIPPSMTSSPTSNLSSAISPPATTPPPQGCTPAILQPAPIARFDFAAFQEQMSDFEYDAATVDHSHSFEHADAGTRADAGGVHGGFQNALGLVSQACQPDVGGIYHSEERFYTPVGEDLAGAAPPPDGTRPLLQNAIANAAADLQGYEEGVRYTQRRPEIMPPRALDFNELIVEGY